MVPFKSQYCACAALPTFAGAAVHVYNAHMNVAYISKSGAGRTPLAL
jgi:hypothetical protein